MPTGKTKGLLNDIGTEELAHVEIVCSIIYQLTKDATPEELRAVGLDGYYTDHDKTLFPVDANGVPWTASYIQSKGDPITDLVEDMAAEQKARTTYDNILRLSDNPEVRDPIKFLRAREVVHFQRFGESLRTVTDNLNSKNFYAFNPAFDKCRGMKSNVSMSVDKGKNM
jgi:spore coat protein JC